MKTNSSGAWLLRDDQKCEVRIEWANDTHVGGTARWLEKGCMHFNITHFSVDYFNRRYNNGVGNVYDPAKDPARNKPSKKQAGKVHAVPDAVRDAD